jgi:histidine triad (HIT) family protein
LTGQPCTFCSIVAGDLPAEVVLDDAHVVAFLDTSPVFRGHSLLAPRPHVDTLADLPAQLVPVFFSTAQRLEAAVRQAMDAPGSLMIINNVVSQSVPHLHLHVIPRRPRDGLRFWLGPRTRYDDVVTLASVGRRIREALAG